jgi:hypothetical protein
VPLAWSGVHDLLRDRLLKWKRGFSALLNNRTSSWNGTGSWFDAESFRNPKGRLRGKNRMDAGTVEYGFAIQVLARSIGAMAAGHPHAEGRTQAGFWPTRRDSM